MEKGNVIWLTGISGAGKTTLGLKLEKKIIKSNKKCVMLDGDIVRAFFENDLGYTRKERMFNVKRIAFAAKLLAENGINVIVANIAPYYEVRDFIREKTSNYIQIYVKVSLDTVIKRDVKGHYKNYEKGDLDNLIGVDDSYDVPRNPNLIVDTDLESISESVEKIINLMKKEDVL